MEPGFITIPMELGNYQAAPSLFATTFCRNSTLITTPTAGAQGAGGRE